MVETLRANLIEGNSRFVDGKSLHPHQDPTRRQVCAEGHHPAIAVLTCADSRVVPEILFDQGLGDLFVIRVAGNVVNNMILGSLEYAVEHLNIRLVLVLGHKRCGAVKAAVTGGELPGHLASLVEPIKAAVVATRDLPGDAVDNACRANIRNVVNELKYCQPVLSEMTAKGKLAIIGAFYDLDTGRVELVE